jgi:ubiquinone/menaquinone biosynthesis C-methylase UbiE
MNREFAIQPAKVENYRSDRGAQAYKADHANRLHRKLSTRREMKIYQGFLDRLGPLQKVLDLPCGHGRLFDLLQAHASAVIEADFSQQMLDLNAADHGGAASRYLQCSALDIPLDDRAVDVTFSIRLNHHLESQESREAHLAELFRVSDRAVVVTWFSATSLKNIWRRLRAPFNRKQPKNTLHNDRAVALAGDAGFGLVDLCPLSRLGSGHVLALFVRSTPR